MAFNIELFLHPVRMRIIQLFISNKELTAGQIIQLIPEVPQASLYRQLSKLAEANIIEIVAEKRMRGTVEKTYRLQLDSIHSNIEELSPVEHQNAFYTFTLHLLTEFNNYIHKENMNFYEDGVSYRQVCVYLDEEEYREIVETTNRLVEKAIENKPREGRKLMTLASIIIPK
ncbi:hypothetical protein CEB3_c50140 [Peptococcaceae bacterium CEB3]|nr:hypothetical protein CEB3_c50140 [Peptococcaceae bacterium CEB3]